MENLEALEFSDKKLDKSSYLSNYDKRYHFKTLFIRSSGFYMRSGIYENGIETSKNPFRATFPHLIDIGIMGHCSHGLSGLCEASGIGCYQNGRDTVKSNMTVNDFRKIAKECSKKTHQFALGGRGDPDEHEDFEEILKICQEYNIVPNYTTSGYTFNKEKAKLSKKYCGAVAVSWYRNPYTIRAIELLNENKVTTNIHYVLGNNTIDEAIERIKNRTFPKVHAIIFLLHKPQGLGSTKNVLQTSDPRVNEFFTLLSTDTFYRFGIDSCTVPGMINYGRNYDINSLDTCEAGRFSCYISADMKMVPCSFDTKEEFVVDLKSYSIQEAFDSRIFDDFRYKLDFSCKDCHSKAECMGGCSLMPEIVLCNRETKLKI